MTEPPQEDFPDEAERDREIGDLLTAIGSEAGAESTVLLDIGSASIVGAAGTVDPDAAVPTLVDSYVSAARRLASLVADVEFVSLAHQGDGSTILLREVTGEWILMAVFRGARQVSAMPDHTEAGVVRLKGVARREPMRTASVLRSGEVGPDWIRAAETEIDRIFGEGA